MGDLQEFRGTSWNTANNGFHGGLWVTPILLDLASPTEPNPVLFSAGNSQWTEYGIASNNHKLQRYYRRYSYRKCYLAREEYHKVSPNIVYVTFMRGRWFSTNNIYNTGTCIEGNTFTAIIQREYEITFFTNVTQPIKVAHCCSSLLYLYTLTY
jgi:hypothetical protein